MVLTLTKENLKDDMDEKSDPSSFEEAMSKLEKIVEALEDGGLTLEESTIQKTHHLNHGI